MIFFNSNRRPSVSARHSETPRRDWGKRLDGTLKGAGYFGPLPMRDGSGEDTTELSVGVEIDGKEHLIPSIVPILSPWEIAWLQDGNDPTPDIVSKATQHAIMRMRNGLSPFHDGK